MKWGRDTVVLICVFPMLANLDTAVFKVFTTLVQISVVFCLGKQVLSLLNKKKREKKICAYVFPYMILSLYAYA